MSQDNSEELIKVEKVEAFFYPIHGIPTMVLYLEDGREFKMFQIPPEIVIALNRLQEKRDYEELLRGDKRENIYDVLAFSSEIKDQLSKIINRVVINDVNEEYGVYIATVEFKFDGVIIEKQLIPSHAVFLAIVSNRPIYVKKSLVDEQEKQERKSGEDV
ncbi:MULTISPECIES: bifunctional nuclease family protein [Sulfolobaceae]|uniref:Bifunctional DNase/RNase n=1 Tax=Sulfurisphaera ohwakuensis TaxID=69656 RepID=A0A650CDP8_SULOH|nr:MULTISPECIES: bifunctional nuclease domain-containing protein [Sulfolobaceae]MBB5253190.1 bifunctional DNase/RNase [Sulfurisphaera ohwakuensis]QGR15898.1 bifunctional nuclease family protein [Sulfurisphaera ohwakuensis]QIW23104.1 bifunctional nuclease family protein [Sulfolobus sp. S-194]